MAVSGKSYRLFLSHAAADIQFVEIFETLLAKSMGLTSEEIFCSSLEGQGVPKGASFVEEIRARVSNADGVVALLTPAYLDSPFCMAELGAAWALKRQRLPIVVPPNTFEVMQATLLGIVGVKIDNEDALAQSFEDFAGSIGISPPKTGVRARAMREFQRAWQQVKHDISPPSRIEASIHAGAMRELDEAMNARDAAEEELTRSEAINAALRKTKDAEAVADIDGKFDDSTWKERIDDALDAIRELHAELGGREITRLLILDHLGKFFRPDFNNFPDEAGRAIELDVYDDENKRWNYGHPEVKELVKHIEMVMEIFSDDPTVTAYFKSKGLKSDPDNIRFWEENL